MYDIVTIGIEGISPLLMHNPAGSMIRDDGDAPARAGKRIPKPYDEARAALYVDTPDSKAGNAPAQLFIPADAVREAGILASKSFRDPSRRGNASWEQRFSSSVFLVTDRFPLTGKDSVTPLTSADEDWAVHTKRAVVQGQGIMRSRALVRDWTCVTVQFEYDTDTISPPDIAMIIRQAGKFPGLLDYRPGKKGPFGRFQLITVNGEPAAGAPADG